MADRRGDGTDIDRRRMLKYLGVGGVVGLAGCSGGGGGDGNTPAGTTPGNATTTGVTPDPPDDGNGNGNAGPMPVGGTFTFATGSTSSPPHPLLASDSATQARLDPMFDGPGGQLGPNTFFPKWFESWNLSDSNDVVTYKLREGLTWGAGYGELTAEDYLYLLNNVILLQGAEDWFGFTDTNFYRLGGEFVNYEKQGKYEFKAELPVERPFWLHEDPLINQIALPKALLEKYVPNRDREGLVNDPEILNGDLSKGESNLGPYRLVSYEQGNRWEYERNPDYYLKAAADEPIFADPYYDFREAPYFNTFVYEVVGTGSDAVNRLDTGSVEAAELPARVANEFAGRADITIWESQFGTQGVWMYLNHRINGWRPINNSQGVRHAIAHLFDRETVVNDIYKGNGVLTHTLHPEWGPFYPSRNQLFVPEGSMERAKSLLENETPLRLGYDERGRFTNAAEEQVTLKAVRPTNDTEAEFAAQYMKRRLGGNPDDPNDIGAGIELEIEAVDPLTLTRDYIETSADNVDGGGPRFDASRFNGGPWNQAASKEDWDLMFGPRFDTSPYAPWTAIRSQVAEQGAFNFTGYHQDDFDIDQFVFDAATADNRGDTQEKLTELFGFLSRDMPVVFTHTNAVNIGFYFSVQHYPGTESDAGYEGTSYFKRPDPVRLQSFQP